MNEKAKPLGRVVWVNVYRHPRSGVLQARWTSPFPARPDLAHQEETTYDGDFFTAKEIADENAIPDRVGCNKIILREEFDGE